MPEKSIRSTKEISRLPVVVDNCFSSGGLVCDVNVKVNATVAPRKCRRDYSAERLANGCKQLLPTEDSMRKCLTDFINSLTKKELDKYVDQLFSSNFKKPAQKGDPVQTSPTSNCQSANCACSRPCSSYSEKRDAQLNTDGDKRSHRSGKCNKEPDQVQDSHVYSAKIMKVIDMLCDLRTVWNGEELSTERGLFEALDKLKGQEKAKSTRGTKMNRPECFSSQRFVDGTGFGENANPRDRTLLTHCDKNVQTEVLPATLRPPRSCQGVREDEELRGGYGWLNQARRSRECLYARAPQPLTTPSVSLNSTRLFNATR